MPVRFISEALGADVEWDTQSYGAPAVLITPSNPKFLWLTLFPGKRAALVSEGVYRFDVPPIIKDDRTMLPVRFIANYLGSNVDWDQANRTVILTSMGNNDAYETYYDNKSSQKISDWLINPNHTTQEFLKIL